MTDLELKLKVENVLSELHPLLRQAKKQGLVTKIKRDLISIGKESSKDYEYFFSVKIEFSRMI
ncbi:hypothetical protein BWZ22_13490 [Seonamhaeicola sp. S2-3]|uniref:hypothetical protein n=1 Tax=Seonamhaeicola sp. S2-3 TaxID=1936081 RepID=UPI000972D953|nr:hypothetical protein [Seonamhaeicola sp. S2-3]APY12160.1 hypothetical protein BWZ22_13415 [Seonamhaeicola sp. S2-3]APY12175.1 hypothetical protein BWZ22_13490 [Seonamhaeicola sp. S2-3]